MQERTYDDVPVERLLSEDWKEKQSAGKGAYSRQSGRRSNGRMPYETLKGKALEDYMGNSEVTTYKLEGFEQIKKERLLEGFERVKGDRKIRNIIAISGDGTKLNLNTFGRQYFKKGQRVDILSNGNVFAIVTSEKGSLSVSDYEGYNGPIISATEIIREICRKTGAKPKDRFEAWHDSGIVFFKPQKGK